MDKAQSFGWLNPCSQSEGSRTSMFVPIIASNLRDVLHITKTVPNYAHLMWVPWLNFVQLEASAWWRIAYKNCMSGLPLSSKFTKSGAVEIDLAVMENMMWQEQPTYTDQTWYYRRYIWCLCSDLVAPCSVLLREAQWSQSDSATEWH